MMARSLRSRSLHDVSAARQPTASRACKQRRAAARQQSNVKRKALLRVIDPEFPYFDHRPRRTVGGLRAEKKKLLPAFNVIEREEDLLLTADTPGVPKESLRVDVVEGKVLVISSSWEKESKEEEEGRILREERVHSSFSRSVRLPESVDAGAIRAKYENGVLHVTIPKKKTEDNSQSSVNIE